MMRYAAVVLAGGEGRRMQGDKPGRVLGGRTLLDRALERARATSQLAAVAVRSEDQLPVSVELPAHDHGLVTTLIDDPAIPGPLAGIASALRFGGMNDVQAVLTIPCDAPFLPRDLLDRLRTALTPGIGCALASSGGRVHPICALWRSGLEGQLAAYVATGRGSLMGLAEAVGWVAVDWPTDPVDPFFNVNSAADLEQAEAVLRSRKVVPFRKG